MTLLTISISGQGFDAAGVILNALDLGPNYIGSLNAVVQTMYCAAAIFAPYTIGILTPNVNSLILTFSLNNGWFISKSNIYLLQAFLSEWRLVFWLVFVLYILITFIYTIWGSAKVQPWNSSQKSVQRA